MRILRGIGFFVSTILIYLGTILLGWGISDLEGYFSSSPRLGYALIVLIQAIGVGFQAVDAPEGIRGSAGHKDKLILRQRIVRYTVTFLLFAALVFLPYADRHGIGLLVENQLTRWIGVALFGLGIGLVYWSGLALGRYYSADVTLQEDHRLITDGPFRYIRHPRYAGAILIAFGLSFIFRSWIGLTISGISIVVFLLRIRDEEALMAEAFREEWEDYCRRTRRLVPLLY
jgi:protein-S-isoprenylcysteine O-methyltransferase Ste14